MRIIEIYNWQLIILFYKIIGDNQRFLDSFVTMVICHILNNLIKMYQFIKFYPQSLKFNYIKFEELFVF